MSIISMHRRARQAGFTLIELMVSLVIGFAVVGALLAAYVASVRSGGANDALGQMTEDASQALTIVRTQLAMAGYANVTNVEVGGKMDFASKVHDSPVFGCTNSNFGDATSASLPTTGPAACSGSTTSDTLEVAYEANKNSPTNAIVDSTGVPLDCIGNALALDPTANVYINDSKFYVDKNTLYCRPLGTGAGAPLVDNVEAMKVTYGMSGGGSTPTNQIASYASTAPSAGGAGWANIVSVTVCVRVRSANKVVDSAAAKTLSTFVDCDNTVQTASTDGYLRRSFSTTVVLQNRI